MSVRPVRVMLLVLACLVCRPGGLARAEDLPYPPGPSTRTIEGLKTALILPESIPKGERISLLVVLHSAAGSATGTAKGFEAWASDGYVVCAPKAKDLTWEPNDIQRTLRIIAHLKEVLPIHPRKVHVVGFSDGGWNLEPLALDDELQPCSATWVASGYRGRQVPKWAKKGLAVLAMAGAQDPEIRAVRDTARILRKKVRSVEVQLQEGLGHDYPRKLSEYHRWWMGVQEGRLTPGDDRSFEWTDDLDAAIAALALAKKGGVLLWIHTAEDAKLAQARAIQHEVFFDANVRFLGRQLRCVKFDHAVHEERIARLGVETAPALVVLDRKGEVKARFETSCSAQKVAKALRKLAPKRTMPK